MTTDELLKAVAQAAREAEDEIDEEIRQRPLDEAARARFTDAILAQMEAEKPAEKIPAPAPPPREGAQVVPLPKRRTWVPAIAALAAAAAVALLVGLPGRGPSNGDPLPAYELSLLGGEHSTRAEPAPTDPRPPLRLGPGSSLEIVLRPASPDRKPIAAGGFLIQDGRARVWPIHPDISPDGAVRVAGERETLFPDLPAGSYEIVIAVGRPGALPDAGAVVRSAAAEPDARVRLFRQSIVLVAP
ncbi:hypothetical protein [Polyangium sp. y55x31]|uniref:hypothetical protein n=1 Tax=Polyangium sp. y55x31 TaxID=3042688 RepID=UPI0024828BAD|nr:hypothetical protein [Polyangium sp. y55x31]MDI1476478.1 hypothetical protein [Polyangium sp. y55x31]